MADPNAQALGELLINLAQLLAVLGVGVAIVWKGGKWVSRVEIKLTQTCKAVTSGFADNRDQHGTIHDKLDLHSQQLSEHRERIARGEGWQLEHAKKCPGHREP